MEETFGNGLQSSQQSNKKIHMAHAKGEDIFSKLNGATYFTTLDLRAGYHHIPLDKSSIPKQHLIHLLENLNT